VSKHLKPADDGHKKFDVIIGNPPYQDEAIGERVNQKQAVYNIFMDKAYPLSERTVLITPARFLSDAGTTPKAWNEKMRQDPHIKNSFYESDPEAVFPGAGIEGGIIVTYRDANRVVGPIGKFIANDDLANILSKVQSGHPKSLMSIISGRGAYKYAPQLFAEQPALMESLTDTGRAYVNANAFSTLEPLFFSELPQDGQQYVKMLGLIGRARYYFYIKRNYLRLPNDFDKYKVIVSKSDGASLRSKNYIGYPEILEPDCGYTETFIGIGAFDTEEEAKACLRYVKTKFARAMLSVLKITQNNPPKVWEYIPLQDFTNNSDIDWSKSISEIDQQLYRKYRLTDDEVKFIETNVKPMA